MSKIIFAGGLTIGCKILQHLINTSNHKVVLAICRIDDSGKDDIFPSLKKICQENEIPYIQPENVNSSDSVYSIRKTNPDLLLSIMYNKLFKTDLIELFSQHLGMINLHFAPLPKYCGYWPEMWAIWNDEKTFGITFHYIDNGIDSGNIIHQEIFSINENETRLSLYNKCNEISFDLFKIISSKFLCERVESIKQDTSKRSYYRKELPNKGMIDLNWGKEKIEKYIRATAFYPFLVGKIQINNNIYSIIDKDLEFFKPILNIGEKI